MPRKKNTAPDRELRNKAEKRLLKEPGNSKAPSPALLEDANKLIHELQVHQIELELQNDELRHAQLELASSQRRYADLFNFAPVGYMLTDIEGSIREANSSAAVMLGVRKEQLVGRALGLYILSDDRSAFAEYQKRVSRLKEEEEEEEDCVVGIKTKDGSLLKVQLSTCRVKGDEEGPRYLLSMTDITKLTELEKEKARYIRDLEDFGATAAHELHAPLFAVTGFARLLAKGYTDCLDAEGLAHLGAIARNAERMEHLISGLIACSQASTRQVNREKIDLALLVRSAYGEVASPDDQKRVTLDLRSLPLAMGDVEMLRQVFVILLSNALKFTAPKGRCTIEVGGSKGRGQNLYYIRDDGVGFDMAYAQNLFRIFQRLHSSKEFPGTGAGLAIARRIIEKHGGHIWAEGKPGEGATFHFTLPD